MAGDFWNTRFPQFLQNMQNLCMQADYLLNRNEYNRYSRGAMGPSIYGYGFPASNYPSVNYPTGCYPGQGAGSYQYSGYPTDAGYGNSNFSSTDRINEGMKVLDAIYNRQSTSSQSSSQLSSRQSEGQDNLAGQNLYDKKDTTFISDSNWSDLNDKISDGDEVSDTDKQTWASTYKNKSTELANNLIKYINDKNNNSSGKISKQEFIAYYKDQLSGTKEDAQLEADAENVFNKLNLDDSGGENLEVSEVALLIAALDTDSMGDVDGEISSKDVTTNLAGLLDKTPDAINSLFSKFFS